MQVDPLKRTLKAPGPKRLKVEYVELLSSFALKFNLRRYTEGGNEQGGRFEPFARMRDRGAVSQAGAHTRPLFSST